MSSNEQNSGLFSWLKNFIDLSSSSDNVEIHSDNDSSNSVSSETSETNETDNVLSTSVLDLTSTSTSNSNSNSTSTSIPILDLTSTEYKIDPSLPLLPFSYNPNVKQILTFHGKFPSININAEDYDYGWSVVVVTDLDYQLLKYLQTKYTNVFISVPSVLADINDELVDAVSVPFKEFMKCIDALSSTDSRYPIVNKFLKFTNTYQYYGLDCPVDWWFESIYSTDDQVNTDIQELYNQVHLHSMNL